MKQRKQEKQRLRDEKREERRRRDLERRRTKEDPIISKVTLYFIMYSFIILDLLNRLILNMTNTV